MRKLEGQIFDANISENGSIEVAIQQSDQICVQINTYGTGTMRLIGSELSVCRFVILKFTDAFTSIDRGKGALPVRFAVRPFTEVFVPIRRGIGALPVLHAILEFTDVFSSSGKGIGALPVVFAILPFTDIFTAIGIGMGAFAIVVFDRSA